MILKANKYFAEYYAEEYREDFLPCIYNGILEGCCTVLFLFFFSGCTPFKPVVNSGTLTYKRTALSERDVKSWSYMDIVEDSIPGISLTRAYNFLGDKNGQPIIVGVIDSGIDIDHEDLKEAIWWNAEEIVDNKKDDDQNGYIDDVHGWNFLGNDTLDLLYAPYALTRMVANYSELFEGKVFEHLEPDQKQDFQRYLELLPKYELRSEQVGEQYAQLAQRGISTDSENEKEYFMYLEKQAMYQYNLFYDPREMFTKDDPDDWNDRGYGNPNVIGFKGEESHGTHVVGILAANRNNELGIKGVAQNVKIIALRTVPVGDEYDKDVALAIRYAVDNGAKVVNMSFGKAYSEHPDWVQEAMEYAERMDVLLVHAVGNDRKNIDVEVNFPADNKNGVEIVNNVITVGAITRFFNERLISEYSNYGKENVDIFAPGSKIWSTVPNNEYAFNQGTSMAAPVVAGVAALIRSYYPALTASQVKHIIMDSGVEVPFKVVVPGSQAAKKNLDQICKSGRIINAYNALLMADRISRGK